MRKNKARQKIGAKGVCMHAVGCECDFWQLKRSWPLLYGLVYSAAFNLRNASKHHKNAKEKKTPAGPKMEQDPKQKDTKTQQDTAKGHAGLLPIWLQLDWLRAHWL